jgi:DnaJ-class molecular chaperone
MSDQERVPRVACSACAGKGMIKQWIEGKPHTEHMGRCEQCSGFGKVKA